MGSFTLAAQISTSHTQLMGLSADSVRKALQEAQDVIPFSILITGARELTEVYEELTGPKTRSSEEVYLWYNLLSDYPGQAPDERIINYQGDAGTGWSGWSKQGQSEVEESFVFSCPNNPSARYHSLAGLEALLQKFPFDGVFLDKFRFPSAANGLETMLSCFCPYCRKKASDQGLDLGLVQNEIIEWNPVLQKNESGNRRLYSSWMDNLRENHPVIYQFIRFRTESIYSLVQDVRHLVDRLGRKLALDLFTPSLAPLVGQDYHLLSNLADWAKPMTYRKAYGPAGLRLEIESLVTGIQDLYHMPLSSILEGIGHYYPLVTPESYFETVNTTTPLNWMDQEIGQAVKLSNSKPVYMGLETVNFPGVIEITPTQVREILKVGLENGINGAVISWDLLNTPLENLYAIRDSL